MIAIPDDLMRAIRAHAERVYPNECCGALLGTVRASASADAVSTGGSRAIEHAASDGDDGSGRASALAPARTVEALHEADNRRDAADAPRRFLITADDYREIERAARARSLEVVGFYHSHPDHPARPSDYDREHALPCYSYVIVSVREGAAAETTSWVLDDDRAAFTAEPVVTPAQPAPGRERGR